MIEQLGTLLTAIGLFKDGIGSVLKWSELSKRKDIQRRIISIQLSLEDIISTAEKIFNIIEEACTSDDQSKVQDLKVVAHSQIYSIRKLSMDMREEEFGKVIKLMAPEFGREIFRYIHPKQERLRTLTRVDDFNIDRLKELYDESHTNEGKEILEGLKNCSNELSSLIKEKINLVDII